MVGLPSESWGRTKYSCLEPGPCDKMVPNFSKVSDTTRTVEHPLIGRTKSEVHVRKQDEFVHTVPWSGWGVHI